MVQKDKRGRVLRMTRGWIFPHAASISTRALKKFAQPNLAIGVGLAVSVQLSIVMLAAIGYQMFIKTPMPIWSLANFLVLIAIAIALRALEGFVHAASHGHWHSSRTLNDIAGNILAALPVFSLVQRYRVSHTLHHARFGSIDDPEFNRYYRLGFDGIDRRSQLAYIKSMSQRLPRYFCDWWDQIQTTPRVVFYSLLWHAVPITILAVFVGRVIGLLLWCAYFLVPMLTILTVIRFIDEAAEHQYKGVTTEFDATNNNVGLIHRWFLHPFHDGWHLVHHMVPAIPFWNLKRAHKWLVQVDPEAYAKNYLSRTRVVQDPIKASQDMESKQVA